MISNLWIFISGTCYLNKENKLHNNNSNIPFN